MRQATREDQANCKDGLRPIGDIFCNNGKTSLFGGYPSPPFLFFLFLFLSRNAFTSQYRHLPLLSQVALPFYLTHQQVFHNNNCNLASSYVSSGARSDSFGRSLGALPRHFPMYPGPHHHRCLLHFPAHHQAGSY